MKLYFNTSLPIWVIVLLFIVLSTATIYLYSLHKLSKPWSFWLPALRVTVIFLLLLALFQPILLELKKHMERGNVVVLLDNSGSMSIKDDYTLDEQVNVAWHLKMFPKKMRTYVFFEEAESVTKLKNNLNEYDKELKRVDGILNLGNLEKTLKETETLGDSLEKLNDDFETLLETIKKAKSKADYLNQDPKDKKLRKGWVRLETWQNIKGADIPSLINSPKYKKPANEIRLIRELVIPENIGNNYGCRLAGFIIPEKSGNYQFKISSDDQSQLFLSTDAEEKNLKQIANVKTFAASPIDFSKEPNQTSKAIKLGSGKKYAFKILFKEGNGGDHLTVQWLPPGVKKPEPIPSSCLAVNSSANENLQNRLKSFELNCEKVQKEFKNQEEKLKLFDKKKSVKENRTHLKAIIESSKKIRELYPTISQQLLELQSAADIELAESGNKVVDEALEDLKNKTRIDLVKYILNSKKIAILDSLKEKGDLAVFDMSEGKGPLKLDTLHELEAKVTKTSLGNRMDDIFKYYENKKIAALIVISDGNNNAGKTLVSIKEMAKEREVPLLAIGIGAPRAPKDIAIDHVITPKTGFKSDSIKANIVLKRNSFENRHINLKIFSDGELLAEKQVPPGKESRLVVTLGFVEERSGFLHYTVQAESLQGEVLYPNNEKNFSIQILKDPIRTLFIDEFPRWESRYCNMMLKRDQRIDLRTIFVASMKDGILETSKTAWPENQNDLNGFQILVMGDTNPGHF
ncbi:MAG: PA14 domain-containing protein, partial [Lentisphaeria bacterium]|nr:PA14 domain-containing protein [Lentisphaeria bacterium]